MRARLLDLGEVGAVRSQSIVHAVAATMRPDAEPVLVLVRPAGALVSLDREAELASEIDTGVCAARGVAVVRSWSDAGTAWRDPHHLLWALALGRQTAAGFAQVEALPRRLAAAAVAAARALGAPAEADGDRRIRIGDGELAKIAGAEVDDALFFASALPADCEESARRAALRPTPAGSPAATLAGALGSAPDLAAVAEALVAAVEDGLGLELIPSLPTPGEMQAIYDWDQRLAVAAEELAPAPAAGALGGGKGWTTKSW